MNKLGINFGADLQGIIDDLPACLTFDGETVHVVAGDEIEMTEIDERGTYKVFERECTVPNNIFNPMPSDRSTLTLDDIKYYIENINNHPQARDIIYTLRRKDGS